MKKITIVSIIVILIFNLIVTKNVYADYPSVISNSIEQENLTQMENAIDPGLTNSLADEGETTIHKGTSNDDGTYSISDETTTTKSTISSSGSGAGIVAGLINIFPTAISAIMTVLVITQQPDTSEIKEFTIQDLVFNKFRLFDINFFEVDPLSTDANSIMKRKVAIWYTAVRRLAIVISLCVLIYIGIRMTLSTVASDKATYKQMLMDWICGFILIFLMQYIIAFAVITSEGIVEMLPEQSTNLENVLMKGNGAEIGIQGQMQEAKGWNFVTSCVLYWMLVYYQIKFMILYFRRLFSVFLLTIVSPIICAVYPIDKIKDKKAQSFKTWIKEIMVNIYIQPLHAMLYIVFIASATEIAKVAPLFAIVFLAALSRGEKIVKNIFNIRGMTSINSLGTIKVR